MRRTHRIMALGLGNLVRSDDGVGIHAIEKMSRDGRVPEEVEVLDGGTLGLQLLPVIQEATHVLAIDAVDIGAPPGTITRFDISDLGPLPGSPSVHQIGFADLLTALRMLGRGPEQMVLLGVQPAYTGWGEKLSAAVQAAVPALIDSALAELNLWVPEPAEAREVTACA